MIWTLLGIFARGMALNLTPCIIGPFVLGLLTWVASMGSPWFGFIIFFTLSLGLGLPLFFLAIFSGNISKLPRSGEWMLWVRKLMGWVLVDFIPADRFLIRMAKAQKPAFVSNNGHGKESG